MNTYPLKRSFNIISRSDKPFKRQHEDKKHKIYTLLRRGRKKMFVKVYIKNVSLSQKKIWTIFRTNMLELSSKPL